MENLPAIIAANLVYLRREQCLTQQDLASKINYSDNAVSRWERLEATRRSKHLVLSPLISLLALAIFLTNIFRLKISQKPRLFAFNGR